MTHCETYYGKKFLELSKRNETEEELRLIRSQFLILGTHRLNVLRMTESESMQE